MRHPHFSLAFATANAQRGQAMTIGSQEIAFLDPESAPIHDVALVFSALPHGASLPWVQRAHDGGARVVDLSHDLRPGNGNSQLEAVYGMPELTVSARAAIRSARIVANPGCYPTCILLALAPLVAAGVVLPGATIIANAASGVTGAGNSPKRELLFGEVAEDFRAYGVANSHRHLKEMNATMATLGADVDLVFTPHLLPVARGILATITVPLDRALDDPLSLYRDAYASEPFVEVVSGEPRLSDVARRNVVRLTATMVVGTRTPTLLVRSALDNLVKGAAGQAIQNANLMLGLDECAWLPA